MNATERDAIDPKFVFVVAIGEPNAGQHLVRVFASLFSAQEWTHREHGVVTRNVRADQWTAEIRIPDVPWPYELWIYRMEVTR